MDGTESSCSQSGCIQEDDAGGQKTVIILSMFYLSFFSFFYLVSSFRVNYGLDMPLGSGLILVVTCVSSITMSSSLLK